MKPVCSFQDPLVKALEAERQSHNETKHQNNELVQQLHKTNITMQDLLTKMDDMKKKNWELHKQLAKENLKLQVELKELKESSQMNLVLNELLKMVIEDQNKKESAKTIMELQAKEDLLRIQKLQKESQNLAHCLQGLLEATKPKKPKVDLSQLTSMDIESIYYGTLEKMKIRDQERHEDNVYVSDLMDEYHRRGFGDLKQGEKQEMEKNRDANVE